MSNYITYFCSIEKVELINSYAKMIWSSSFEKLIEYGQSLYSGVSITHQARNFAWWVSSNLASFRQFLAIFCNFSSKFGKRLAKFAQNSWLDELSVPHCTEACTLLEKRGLEKNALGRVSAIRLKFYPKRKFSKKNNIIKICDYEEQNIYFVFFKFFIWCCSFRRRLRLRRRSRLCNWLKALNSWRRWSKTEDRAQGRCSCCRKSNNGSTRFQPLRSKYKDLKNTSFF